MSEPSPPTLTSRKQEAGEALYLAVGLSEDRMTHLLLNLCDRLEIKPPIDAIPHRVQVSERRSASHRYLFLLNPHDKSAHVPVPDTFSDAMDGSACGSKVDLGPWDVRVLQERINHSPS